MNSNTTNNERLELQLSQYSDGYLYTSDSMFLYAFIYKYFNGFSRVLDVGSGCGILGLMLKRDFKDATVFLNEINEKSIWLIEKNMHDNNLHCELLSGDFLHLNTMLRERFDLIISNPPFYPKDSKPSPNKDIFLAKSSINLPLDKLLINSKWLLQNEGRLIFCYSAKRFNEVVNNIANSGLYIDVLQFIYPSDYKDASLVILSLSLNKTIAKIISPIVYLKNGEVSTEAKEVFNICKTRSIKIIGSNHDL